jgi:TolB-like protein/Tfp pilus assembly protein PilF
MAVLPFVNASPDPANDYLGYGVAAELTRMLGRMPGVRVAERSSAFGLRQTKGDPRVAGRRLDAGTVLLGSVRRSDDRLRVTARLLDVENGFDLWSETYERTPAELLAIQNEIRHAVAGALHVSVDPTFGPPTGTASAPAYDAYLLGRYALDQSTLGSVPRAIAALTRAIQIDTAFARAHAALAEAYLRRGGVEALSPLVAVPQAREEATRALELDSTLAEAHTALGTIYFAFDRDWRRAEVEFRRAIALQPGWPEAHRAYSRFLLAMGRIDESHQASERALQLSPLSAELTAHLGWHYLHARQYDRARETLARAIYLDSTVWRTHLEQALLEQVAGNYREAEARLSIPLQVAPERAEVQAALGQVYALTGRVEEAQALLQQLQDATDQRYISPYLIASLQASLGQRTRAFASLDRAVKERSELIAYLRIDPRVDSLRADRRFSRLLRRLRLP